MILGKALRGCAAGTALVIAGCGGGGVSSGGGGGGKSTPLLITTTALPKAVTGSPYQVKMQASGGEAPYSWSLGAGSSLPPGLGLQSDGSIAGTATAGCYSVWFPQFVVRDATAHTAGVGLELDCVAPLAFSSTTLPETGSSTFA